MNSATFISATEAARNFSDMLNRVRYRGERFEIVRGGAVVARLDPPGPGRMTIGELRTLLASLPALSAEEARAFADDMEAIRRAAPSPASPWA